MIFVQLQDSLFYFTIKHLHTPPTCRGKFYWRLDNRQTDRQELLGSSLETQNYRVINRQDGKQVSQNESEKVTIGKKRAKEREEMVSAMLKH